MALIFGSHVEIIRLDLIEGTPHLILHVLAPNTSHDNPYVQPKICGDLVSIGIHSANQMLLVKLSTAEEILFTINENHLVLINGHLVTVITDKESGALRLDVFAEESLQQLWKPAFTVSPAWRPGEWGDHDGSESEQGEDEDESDGEDEEATRGPTRCRLVSTKDVQPLVSETINTLETHNLRPHRLAVHECPVGDGDEYVIWVYCSPSSKESPPDGGTRSFVYKYRLRLPSGSGEHGDRPSMQLLLVTSAKREWVVHSNISYAGHTGLFDWEGRHQRILALAELHLTEPAEDVVKEDHRGDDDEAASMKIDHLERLELDGFGDCVDVSAYSGALTYSTKRDVVVKYYD